MKSTKTKKKAAGREGVSPKRTSDYFNPDPKTAAEVIRDLVLANRILAYEGIPGSPRSCQRQEPEKPGELLYLPKAQR